MYYVNKLVGWCLSPFGILFIGVVGSWLLRRYGWGRIAKWISMVVLGLVWIFGCGITTRLIGVPLERRSGSGCILNFDDIPSASAIVLLGGGMGAHCQCGASEMFGAADRTWLAAKLYKAGKAPVITLSGGGAEQSTVPLLIDLGVPKSVCKFFPSARNTEEEARYIRDVLSDNPKILLVTSAFHMPRARMLFERRGFEVVPCPTDFEMSFISELPVQVGDFFPSADALLRNSIALKEWVALIGYMVLRR